MSVFHPSNGGLGIRLSATSTTSRAAVVGTGDTLIVSNMGDLDVYVAFGDSSVTATTACYPVLAGTKEEMLIGYLSNGTSDITYIAVITAGSDTTTLVVNRGSR